MFDGPRYEHIVTREKVSEIFNPPTHKPGWQAVSIAQTTGETIVTVLWRRELRKICTYGEETTIHWE